MNVSELMSNDIRSINSAASVIDAAIAMKDYNVGVIPVLNESELVVGVITDRDIVLRCVAENCNSYDKKAKEIMSSKLLVVNPETQVDRAAQLMSKYQVRRLPVVEQDHLVGMLSLGDIATDDECNCDTAQTLECICEK